MTVWKYPAPDPLTLYMAFSMPKSAVFLTLQLQNGVPMMWWLVDDGQKERERYAFHLIGTGQPVPEKSHYLATYQQGPFVWHIFEED